MLPVDPVTGQEWWRINVMMILLLDGWPEWQAYRPMAQIIPVLRWRFHGAIPTQQEKRDD